ncbi:MAG: TadE family type IV pilus minor pilin [Kineosporiaceae bacterium]
MSAAARARREAGSVTAEAAIVLPVLVAVVTLLLAVLSLAATRARCEQAAGAAARQAARSATPAQVRAAALAVTGDPRTVVETAAGSAGVRVAVRLPTPRLIAAFGSTWVAADAAAPREPGPWPP